MTIESIIETLNSINHFGKLNNGVTRLAFSDEDKDCKEYFISECEKEGLRVRVDTFGNVIARRQGRYSNLPVVAFGSHLDTVVEAGDYDGVLGVVAGLEVIRRMNSNNYVTDHPLELIIFACEESSRFNMATLGSKAMIGSIDENIKSLEDKDGVTIEEVFNQCHLNIYNIKHSKRDPSEIKVFLELHIEQGPVLANNKKTIGIVKGIASATRLVVEVQGQASHSGTTPMLDRKDALIAASEIVLILEKIINDEVKDGTVGTIGVMNVSPGVMNVIPGKVEMKVDIRGTSTDSKKYLEKRFQDEIDKIALKRDVSIITTLISREEPVFLNKMIIQQLKVSCEKLNLSYKLLDSGAGHDAMNMGRIFPTGLIFLPSKDGISHNPDEYTSIEDIESGISLLEANIMYWANSNNKIK